MTDRTSQRDRILAKLKAAGPRGCTNVELNVICFRYGGRIFELRKDWDIETVPMSKGVFRFILRGVREAKQLELMA